MKVEAVKVFCLLNQEPSLWELQNGPAWADGYHLE